MEGAEIALSNQPFGSTDLNTFLPKSGGHFGAKNGGHFHAESSGHFETKKSGHIRRNLHPQPVTNSEATKNPEIRMEIVKIDFFMVVRFR